MRGGPEAPGHGDVGQQLDAPKQRTRGEHLGLTKKGEWTFGFFFGHF